MIFQTKCLPRSQSRRSLGLLQEGIDHHVSDEKHPVGRYSLAREVNTSAFLRGEEKVRDGVGQDPIDLLRHGAVEAAEPCFHVGHFRPTTQGINDLDRRQSACDGRIHVSDYNDQVGLPFDDGLLEALQNPGSLNTVALRADLEPDVRLGEVEIPEENVRQSFIIVLPGVNQCYAKPRTGSYCPIDRGHFHEVWPGTSDEKDRDATHRINTQADKPPPPVVTLAKALPFQRARGTRKKKARQTR